MSNNNEEINNINIKPQKIKKTANMKEYKTNYMKKYRQENPECWKKEKTCPDCGSTYQASAKTAHIRSMKHKNAVMSNKLSTLEETFKKLIQSNTLNIKMV